MDDALLTVSCPAVIPLQTLGWVSSDILKELVSGYRQLIICLEPGTTEFVKHVQEKWTDPTIMYVEINSLCETLGTLSHLDFCIAASSRNFVRDRVNACLNCHCSMLFGEEKPQCGDVEYDVVLELCECN